MRVGSDIEKVTHILQSIRNAERRFRDRAASYFIAEPALLPTLINFITHEKEQLADRACWTLELVCIHQPDLLCPFTDKIADQLQDCGSDRQRRPLGKICSLLSTPVTAFQEPWCNLSESAVEKLVSWGFEQLIEERPVAVKVFSMQILFNLRNRKSWIRNELQLILQENMFKESPGYQARAKKILRQI